MGEIIIELDWTSDHLVRKLEVKHGLDWRDVDRAIKWHRIEARWHEDKKHGERLIVKAGLPSDGSVILAYLIPVNRKDGIWRLKTAYKI